MSFLVLTYFLAIANEESITGACEVLHVTQPTVSRQISDLEKDLGHSKLI
ncbi:MAG: LysR family transcriptional regulator [Treponema sp.]|nr:LysR family transcriptional regulator [Treponema sp.]